ncbi:MAG: DUF2709 domain-containing protein [Waddliaceae bacterium]
MGKAVITEKCKKALSKYLRDNPSAELVNTYLAFIENTFNIQPVVFPKEKLVFKTADEAVKYLEEKDKLWHHAEIKISLGQKSVNEETKRIYICPFTGKVFGDNTHPNPQDAIYDWVSKCPENNERVGGLRVKRFFISEDPEVIKNYISKETTREPITKTVYSSLMNGKIFNNRKAVVEDFKSNYLKPMSLVEVQNQNRFNIEDKFLEFIQEQLNEEKVTSFVEAMAEEEEFTPTVASWLE